MAFFENFVRLDLIVQLLGEKLKAFQAQTNQHMDYSENSQGYNNDEMLHLKEEDRQLLQSILVTSLISKETCWIA